jgi:hypothetical protein
MAWRYYYHFGRIEGPQSLPKIQPLNQSPQEYPTGTSRDLIFSLLPPRRRIIRRMTDSIGVCASIPTKRRASVADTQNQVQTLPTHDALDETLNRISKKTGVKATLVLDRATGSVLRTSGQVSSLRTSKSSQTAQNLASPSRVAFPSDQTGTPITKSEQEIEAQEVNSFAALVWAYVNASGALVQELDNDVGYPFPSFVVFLLYPFPSDRHGNEGKRRGMKEVFCG